jgi:hypothetical protein
MALSIIEQLKILQGTISPVEVTLEEMVEQVAVLNMVDFRDNHSNPSGNTDATSYVSKMLNLAPAIYRINKPLVNDLTRLVIAIYAPTGDYATVQAASDDAWTTFIENNMTKVLQQYLQITQGEITAYEAL